MEDSRTTARGNQKPSPTAPVQQDFLFVDASKAKSSRQGRRNARSFVMQKARRERPWSTSKHAAKQRKVTHSTSPAPVRTPDLSHTPITSTPSPPIVTTGPGYFPHVEPILFSRVKQEICYECQFFPCIPGQTLCQRCFLLNSPRPGDIDNRLFDPFGTVSIELDASSSKLLEHYVSQMAPISIAVDIRRTSNRARSDWFGTALGNSGFMHSLLCTAALHLYCLGECSMETILDHKARAIEAVNAALQHPDSRIGLSDANIGTVFNLLTIDEGLLSPYVRNINKEEFEDQLIKREVHLTGLRNMVQMRGGLAALSSNRILQAFILWHSTAHAIASFNAPYISNVDYICKGFVPPHPPGYQPRISYHLIESCRQARVKESLTGLVESALVLIADLNVSFDDPYSGLDPVDIQNFSCVLECRLLDWIRHNQAAATPLEDAICVSLLIFAVRVTEAVQNRGHAHVLHRAASKRLEKALSATSRYEWTYCQDLLLWILTVGAISAEGSPEHGWFVYQASLACQEFGIHSSDGLLCRLHICGWVSYKLDDAVHGLWAQILNLRHEPSTDPNNYNNMTAGPLQMRVSTPTFVDWQNDDWATLSHQMRGPAETGGAGGPLSARADEGLYNVGISYTRRNSLYYMGLSGGAPNDSNGHIKMPASGN